jgi:hypothetical protein
MVAASVIGVGAAVLAQAPGPARSPSPDGVASMQAGMWKADDAPATRVANGKWIEILYGRPLRRGRTNLFGSGAAYGTALKGGAAVWRAGANVLTRLRTEAPLTIGGKTVAPGEYTVFIDIAGPTSWTLIVSSQPANAADDVPTRSRVWEAFRLRAGQGCGPRAHESRNPAVCDGATDLYLHGCHGHERRRCG